jgi:HAE1 family hydrophobic/amphiphilic exporter-1
MNLTKLAVHRPIAILMIVLGLVVMGTVSYGFLPVRELPDLPQTNIEVSTSFPGASPADVRRLVTDRLQQGLERVNGVAQMNSISTQGQSKILLKFSAGIPSDTAATDVSQAIHRVAKQLPKTASLPTITQRNPADIPMIQLTLGGKLSSGQLAQYANDNLFPLLQSVPGVAGVTITGATLPQINVTADPERLTAYGVTIDDIARAVNGQNAGVPGGMLQSGDNSFLTATTSPFTTDRSLQNIVVGTQRTDAGLQSPILLGQVAEVSQSLEVSQTRTSADNENAIGVAIGVQNGANSLTVETGVIKALQSARKDMPPGIKLKVLSDLTLETRAALHAVVVDLLIAIVLTSLVLYVFLRRFAHTAIVLLAIPTSLVSTFTVMYALGFSLDLMSLLGLSLLIGILVDDSIVVLENIDRHLEKGLNSRDAAIRGRMEIGAAAVAITLTDVVVYAPVAFVHGQVGALFREFGLTIVAATLFSLFISFTLTPMLASRWLKPHKKKAALPETDASGAIAGHAGETAVGHAEVHAVEHAPSPSPSPSRGWGKLTDGFMDGYTGMISWALRHRGTVSIIGIACLACSLLFVPLGWIQTAFLPDSNPNLVQINASFPPGTALDQTEKTISQYVDKLKQEIPDSTVYAVSGQSSDGTTASNAATLLLIRPVEKLSPTADEMIDIAREQSTSLAGLKVQSIIPSPLVDSGTSPVDVAVTGLDPKMLADIGAQVADRLTKVDGLTEVRNHAQGVSPEWRIQLDTRKAPLLHATSTQVGQAVQQAVQGNVVTSLQAPGSSISQNIFLQMKNGDKLTEQQVSAIPINVEGGRIIRVGDVANISRQPGPTELSEMNNLLAVHITANLDGITTGQADKLVKAALADLDLTTGYTYHVAGQVADQQLAFGPLTQSFALSVILIYMLMAALYESFVTPMVVLFSLPLASVGAFVGLLITGQSLNVFSFIAMIMLMGLVAKNAILLVDFANTMISSGMDRFTALIRAGRTRLRPIVMTTATMVISMLPLALDRGVGSADRVPVAVVLIGGMLSSTLLTLIVVPVLYTFFDDLRQLFKLGRRRRLPTPVAVQEADAL